MRNPILVPTLVLGLLASVSHAEPIWIASAGSGAGAIGARDFGKEAEWRPDSRSGFQNAYWLAGQAPKGEDYRSFISEYFRAGTGGWSVRDHGRLLEGWPWNIAVFGRNARNAHFPGVDAPALYRPSIKAGMDFIGAYAPVLHRPSIKGGMDFSSADAPALHRPSIKGGMDFSAADAPAMHGPSIMGWIEDVEFGGAHETWPGLSFQTMVPGHSPKMPAVPEPSVLALFALGLVALAGLGLRTRRVP